MRTMGFGRDDGRETPKRVIPQTEEQRIPVYSLVRIRFADGDRELTYFNERFDLKEGDRVFVSGKLAGKIGRVCSVSTRFRIRLSDFERVIGLAQTPISGVYRPVADKMLSLDGDALSPETFRTWILPPEEPGREAEILYGDGYSIPLDDPRRAEDADDAVIARALDCCKNGKIGYISVQDGVGSAYIEGSKWHEAEFRIRDGQLINGYCGCPYPGLCKHLLAVAITLSALSNRAALDLDRDFVLIDADRFFGMIRHNRSTVTL